MLSTEFSPITLEDAAAYRRIWEQTPARTADSTLTNLWGWAEQYGLQWRLAHGLVWLRQTRHAGLAEDAHWAPVGDWNAVDWAAVPEMQAGMELVRVPEQLSGLWAERLPGRVVVEETQGQWEYLYESTDLANLSGNRFHKKKNHVNAFLKAYGEDYRPLTSSDLAAVLLLQKDWCLWRECEKSEALLSENDATERVLKAWDELGTLVGGALFVEDVMVAFTVGEPLDEKSLVIHFEKGRPEYRGVYQAINWRFAREMTAYAVLNREQDADEEGLRKAKESYLPSGYLKKNRVRVLPA